MTDILLGGNFSALYTGKCNQIDSSQELDFKANASYMTASIKAGVNYQTTSFQNFKNVNIYIKTQGGTQPIVANISQNSNRQLDNVTMDYQGWMNSVTQSTESLIGVGNPDTRIYLITEFIEDPQKKREVEFAFRDKRIEAYSLKDYNSDNILIYTTNASMQPINNYSLQRGRYKIISENGYFKIRGCYGSSLLDSNVQFSSPKSDQSQCWKFHFTATDGKMLIQNIATGKYLSPQDAKLYNKPSKNEEEKFSWNLMGWTLPK